MKKSLNKVIVTLAAVAALAMGTTAMAADVTGNETITDGKSTVTYTVADKEVGEQVTVLMLVDGAMDDEKIEEGEIAYIDQVAANEEGKAVFSIPLADVEAGDKYTLMSGSEKADEPTTNKVTMGQAAVNYGDVKIDGKINVQDAQITLKIAVGNADDATEEQIAAANVDGSASGVNVQDAQAVLTKAVGNEPKNATAAENMSWYVTE